MYCAYRNHATAAFSCLCFTIYNLSPIFRPDEQFRHTFLSNREAQSCNLVHTLRVGSCIVCTKTMMLLLLLIGCFISPVLFSLYSFQTLKIFPGIFLGFMGPRRIKPRTRE